MSDYQKVKDDRRNLKSADRRQRRDTDVEALFKQFGAVEERGSGDRRSDD